MGEIEAAAWGDEAGAKLTLEQTGMLGIVLTIRIETDLPKSSLNVVINSSAACGILCPLATWITPVRSDLSLASGKPVMVDHTNGFRYSHSRWHDLAGLRRHHQCFDRS